MTLTSQDNPGWGLPPPTSRASSQTCLLWTADRGRHAQVRAFYSADFLKVCNFLLQINYKLTVDTLKTTDTQKLEKKKIALLPDHSPTPPVGKKHW